MAQPKPHDDTFYCPICIGLQSHNFYKTYDQKIECKGCGDLKEYVVEKRQIGGTVVKVYPSPYLGYLKKLKCVVCEEEPMMYTSACFKSCGIFEGKFTEVPEEYIDMARPMCKACHHKICNSESHLICKAGYRLSRL
jgi:hypothetical protein